MSGRQDLPGYSDTQETATLGILAVQEYLIRSGFKVMEVTGRFDDGLDLLVAPHDRANVFPAIAGIQVRSGSSHRSLKVGRHECYWRELNLPVFGVILTDLASNPPTGKWCNAQAYLRNHADVSSVPTPHNFPDGLADAINTASAGQRALTVALDVFSADWARQVGAVAALAPLSPDRRVLEMLRLRLGELGPRATQYALNLLVYADVEDVNSHVTIKQIAKAINMLYESDIDGHFDVEAFQDGSWAVYCLLSLRNIDPKAILDEALQSHTSETTIMLVAMAVSLAGSNGETILREALDRRPNLSESSDIADIARALSEGGYDFSW